MSLFKIFRNYNVNKLQFGKKNYYVPTEMLHTKAKFCATNCYARL